MLIVLETGKLRQAKILSHCIMSLQITCSFQKFYARCKFLGKCISWIDKTKIPQQMARCVLNKDVRTQIGHDSECVSAVDARYSDSRAYHSGECAVPLPQLLQDESRLWYSFLFPGLRRLEDLLIDPHKVLANATLKQLLSQCSALRLSGILADSRVSSDP